MSEGIQRYSKRAHLDELIQVFRVLQPEILDEIHTLLDDGVYATSAVRSERDSQLGETGRF